MTPETPSPETQTAETATGDKMIDNLVGLNYTVAQALLTTNHSRVRELVMRLRWMCDELTDAVNGIRRPVAPPK